MPPHARRAPDHGPTLALTMGDPAGIGPEITVKLLAAKAAATRRWTPLVVGDAGTMERAIAALGAPLRLERIDAGAIASVRGSRPGGADERGVVRLVQAGPDLPADTPVATASAPGGRASYVAVTTATDLALAGEVDGIVTAPINKSAWHLAGIDVPGHTELLAARAGCTEFGMMLANDELRVMLVSIHVPLARAVALVTPAAVLRTIRLADRGARDFGVERPRVAVAGLNPHAGEGGMFGTEDDAMIAPAVAAARAAGIDASGPFPPDTVFMRARAGEFDIVVAQYHDQGLIPIKYLGLDQGVNVTVGLPFVRTSVDHGTAYDIAGQGKANPASLAYATDAALRMIGARRRAAR